ncbi:MAG: hypothetical protein GXY65_10585 [Rhodococcus sp.]|uniref:hypothetical protein n=1 Tax=Rhodococcus TaxID=1827 RepID=UPI0016AC515B|nr:hypothetical protein [Rhodococcus sp. (in: high G+C Gram-positive bacteria)]NLV79765.1 hypothetical protein [Rhodococcus sp. (in: high G+C Gram-positive bacteria)]
MIALDPPTRRGGRIATVDIAGTAWPLYKLEAVAVGAVGLLILAVVTTDAQTSVLGAAAIATVTWFVRLAHYRRDDRPGETSGTASP